MVYERYSLARNPMNIMSVPSVENWEGETTSNYLELLRKELGVVTE